MVETLPSALRAVDVAVTAIREKSPLIPRVGLILGSGLGRLASRLESATDIPFDAIPNLPRPSVAGHAGQLTLGSLNGVPAACLRGRVHLYEGHSPEHVVFGARMLAGLGCEVVVLTNAAGATNTQSVPGTPLLIADHINLTGKNPLVGFRQPTQFLDVSNLYDRDLRERMLQVAQAIQIPLREGVYAGLLGPSYETCAEVNYLARIGADAVGMSTVLEAIALCDLGVKVLGLSCITNYAAGVKGAVLDHEHVQATANQGAANMEQLILGWVKSLFGASQ